MAEKAGKAGYPLRGIPIPRPIDKELLLKDHTPGLPSAVSALNPVPRVLKG